MPQTRIYLIYSCSCRWVDRKWLYTCC